MRVLLHLWVVCIVGLLVGCEPPPPTAPTGYERLYGVKEYDEYGYFDSLGRKRIPPQFAYAFDFSEGLGAVNIGGNRRDDEIPTDGKWGFVNGRGTFLINPRYTSPPTTGKLYDPRNLALSLHDGYRFNRGLAAVYYENRWVYIDRNDSIRIPYALVPVENGRASQRLQRRLCGCSVDTTYTRLSKREIAQIEFQRVPVLSARQFTDEGLASVFLGEGWGYINRRGIVCISPRYLFPVDFNNAIAVVVTRERETIAIDTCGQQILAQYKLETEFNDHRAAYRAGFKGEPVSAGAENLLGIVTSNGLLFSQPYFEDAGTFSEGLMPVLVGAKRDGVQAFADQASSVEFEGGKWGYSSDTGLIVINPRFDAARPFSGGLAAVKVGRLWGFINKSGNAVFRPQFLAVGSFEGPLARVIFAEEDLVGKEALIDRNGNIVWVEP